MQPGAPSFLGANQDGSQSPSQPQRPTRSKTGCMTCRRRKVRCDEQRPRCSHCTRLNLQCRWRPSYHPTAQWKVIFSDPSTLATTSNEPGQQDSVTGSQGGQAKAVPGEAPWMSNSAAVDQLFDYASFMWEAGGEMMGYAGAEHAQMDLCSGTDSIDPWPNEASNMSIASPQAPICVREPLALQPRQSNHTGWSRASSVTRSNRHGMAIASTAAVAEDHDLISYFVRTIVPPILAEVETQRRWASMRQILVSMSNNSAMVKCAILAFTGLLYQRREAPSTDCSRRHYEMALGEIIIPVDTLSADTHTPLRQNLLATLFFLSYVDILEDRVENAHEHLKRAYDIFQQANKRGFRPIEIRLLSWIRLLDARAVSAGGEGLFLSDSSEMLIVQPSPSSVDEAVDVNDGAPEAVREWDIEDSLFQVIYSPGIVFFQKVQSFMGRISMIDPWHRSRGTVEDEMEVTTIAARIMKDLREIYDQRPTLMDHAVQGQLKPPHISATLAVPITRAFRTYLSNYYASKIHLHRVAFKHLPLSRETVDAMEQIRRLTRLLVEELDSETALPVSQLWPLLMLGSEEDDPGERAWIKDQILRMSKVATNAKITANVLEEVQARQDAAKSRVDIRSVMHDIFDSCFAIM